MVWKKRSPRVEAPYSEWGGGGGSAESATSASSATSRRTGDIIHAKLPRTVGEVKALKEKHSAFDLRGLSDDFAFSVWCLLIPHPFQDDSANQDPSLFLTSNRAALGDSLPDNVLLLIRVNASGDIDRGFSAEVMRALEWEADDFPALLFLREPVLRIRVQYDNKELIELKDNPLNGIAISIGDADVKGLTRVITQLPKLLRFDSVPVEKLRALVEEAVAASTWRRRRAKAGQYTVKVLTEAGKAAVKAGAGGGAGG